MHLLPPGKYYIGDPCYIFGNSWQHVLDETNYFEDSEPREVFDQLIIGGSTAYGDGTYEDNQGRKYWVDAGLIGIAPIALIAIDKKKTIEEIEASEGMHIVEFPREFGVEIYGGKFTFGDININTTGEDKDEEEDEWDFEEDFDPEDDNDD